MFYFKEETYKINGAAMKVYNTLRHGFLEAVYQEALEIEFKKQDVPFEREKELKIYYDGVELKQTYRADFVTATLLLNSRLWLSWMMLTVVRYIIICVQQVIKSAFFLILVIMMVSR